MSVMAKYKSLGCDLSKAAKEMSDAEYSQLFYELERLRSIARHNEASALRHEREQNTIEIAKNLIKVDVPVEKIITATGLSREEVENLSNAH